MVHIGFPRALLNCLFRNNFFLIFGLRFFRTYPLKNERTNIINKEFKAGKEDFLLAGLILSFFFGILLSRFVNGLKGIVNL